MILPWTIYYAASQRRCHLWQMWIYGVWWCFPQPPPGLFTMQSAEQESRGWGGQSGVTRQITRQLPAALGTHSLTQTLPSPCHPDHDKCTPCPTQPRPLGPGVIHWVEWKAWPHHVLQSGRDISDCPAKGLKGSWVKHSKVGGRGVWGPVELWPSSSSAGLGLRLFWHPIRLDFSIYHKTLPPDNLPNVNTPECKRHNMAV